MLVQVADRRGVGVWRRRTIYEACARYGPMLLDAIRNSTLFLASKVTVESVHSAVTRARELGAKVRRWQEKTPPIGATVSGPDDGQVSGDGAGAARRQQYQV